MGGKVVQVRGSEGGVVLLGIIVQKLQKLISWRDGDDATVAGELLSFHYREQSRRRCRSTNNLLSSAIESQWSSLLTEFTDKALPCLYSCPLVRFNGWWDILCDAIWSNGRWWWWDAVGLLFAGNQVSSATVWWEGWLFCNDAPGWLFGGCHWWWCVVLCCGFHVDLSIVKRSLIAARVSFVMWFIVVPQQQRGGEWCMCVWRNA